jgi:hypothetical protein
MIPFRRRPKRFSPVVSLVLIVALDAGALRAQQPTTPAPQQQTTTAQQPGFDELLSDDSYKLYLEVRNVGQLLTTGGAGEIVEPIIKLADPGQQLKSLVAFLKDHAEALATSRLMFVTWPARTGIPTTMAVIEFATPEEAKKFTPQLEKFLPEVMPPVPVYEPAAEPPGPQPSPSAGPVKVQIETKQKPAETAPAKPKPTPSPQMRSPFVITQSGSLVFIADKPFQQAKLHPQGKALLAEDNNFRTARDRFASEPLFFFFNVKLEDKTQPKPSPTPVISEEEQERIRQEEEARIKQRIEEDRAAASAINSENVDIATPGEPTLTARVEVTASPTPTPTKEQEAQQVASNQIGSMMSLLGQGEPQWPDAIGLAVALDNDEYVLRGLLIESEAGKRVTLPFVPQLITGPSQTADAPSILPDDTEILASASIDFTQTYREMKKQAEAQAKAEIGRPKWQRYENGILVEQGQIRTSAPDDSFTEFEKKAGFKIVDDLLPVLGTELAVGMSLKQANMVNMFGIPTPPSAKSSSEKKNTPDPLPVFMVAIRDRDAARRLMPKVLTGLGIGEAVRLAQTERVGDSEIVNFLGVVSYGFIGNFLVVSDSATVRRVADANMNRVALSSNNAFRSSRHWQPRQTQGEIYISPVLMEGYQEQISKQAGTMDQSMRDFLMKLSPKSSAITYAFSRDGLGALHELHLPKNLILAMVASTSSAMSAMKQGSPEMDEMIAMSALRMIANAEDTYKSTAGNGSYGSIDQLVAQKLVSKEVFEKYGYRVELSTSSHGFEAVAMPLEYGKTGKRSFFIDQSNMLRGGDHGGGPATVADGPIQQ